MERYNLEYVCMRDPHMKKAGNGMWVKFEDVEAIEKLESNMAILPKELTAENGAKHLLMGEFHEDTSVVCPDCGGDGCFEIGAMDPIELCEICEGSGSLLSKTMVGWTTIKDIYKKIVEHYA